MKYVFRGRDEFPAWLRAVEQEALTVSPGGAAALIGVSRQRIEKLLDLKPDVRAWVYYEGLTDRAEYVEISVRDVLRYGLKVGRITSADDVGLKFSRLREVVASLNEELYTAV